MTIVRRAAWLADLCGRPKSDAAAVNWILVAVVVAGQQLDEIAVVLGRVGEQRHRRTHLHVIGRPEDLADRAVLHGVDQPRAFVQSRPEHVVAEIGARLVE